jgi:hypothetical protein
MPRQEFVALLPGFAICGGKNMSRNAKLTAKRANVIRFRVDIKTEIPFLSAREELQSKGPT